MRKPKASPSCGIQSMRQCSTSPTKIAGAAARTSAVAATATAAASDTARIRCAFGEASTSTAPANGSSASTGSSRAACIGDQRLARCVRSRATSSVTIVSGTTNDSIAAENAGSTSCCRAASTRKAA